MPWNPKQFRAKHNKSLTPAQAVNASKIANAILEDTGDDGQAIRIANAKVKDSQVKDPGDHAGPKGKRGSK
jgi:uncharacterized protein YdaT